MIYNTKLLEKAIRARFHQQYGQIQSQPHLNRLSRLYTPTTSNGSEEKYAWLGDIPGVREWVGEKSLGGLKDYDYTIKNKDWYDGFAIDRNELEDEQIDGIMPRVDMLAMELAKWPSNLVVDLIKNGDSNLAYDGSAFFADRSTNDNLLSGSGTTVSNIKTDIQTVRATMMQFESDTGRVMGLMPDTLVVPPQMEVDFLEAVRSATTGDSVTADGIGYNPLAAFGMNVIALPELSDSDDWYAFATQFPLRPFIVQSRKAPESVLDDTEVNRNRKLYYSAEMRGNAGYGFPQMAIKVVNS